MKRSTYTLTVRSYELDSFGHVNNSVYLQKLSGNMRREEATRTKAINAVAVTMLKKLHGTKIIATKRPTR